MTGSLPDSIRTLATTVVERQEGARYTVDYADDASTTITRRSLRFMPDGPLRYVRTIRDPRAVINFGSGADDVSWSHCWVEHHPASDDTATPVTIRVPIELRAGDVLEICPATTAERPAGGFHTISTYAVVQSITRFNLTLTVFGEGLKSLAQAWSYSEEVWGNAFTQQSLHSALEFLLTAGTTGRGAQCVDVLMRALAAAPDSERHQTVVNLARDYAQHQRPRS
jgi:hypothetical protein